MFAARVIGTAVCTRKDERMNGLKMQVIEPVSLVTLEVEGKPIIAIDAVGAGVGEIVLIVGGSSSRQTDTTKNKPVDATIMGILDHINIDGKDTYTKSEHEAESLC